MDIYTGSEQQSQTNVPVGKQKKQSSTSSFGVRTGQCTERKCYSKQRQEEAAYPSISEGKQHPILNNGHPT